MLCWGSDNVVVLATHLAGTAAAARVLQQHRAQEGRPGDPIQAADLVLQPMDPHGMGACAEDQHAPWAHLRCHL